MISKNGTTWTDPNETHSYHEKFLEKHKADKIGEPCCLSCGKATCYVVEEVQVGFNVNPKTQERKTWAKFKTPGVRIFANNVCFFIDEDMAFFPIQRCTGCSATQDGFQCGMEMPGDLTEKHLREDRARRNLTEEEFKLWSSAFNLAYHKGTAAAEKAKAAGRKGSNAKYMPAHTSASPQQETII